MECLVTYPSLLKHFKWCKIGLGGGSLMFQKYFVFFSTLPTLPNRETWVFFFLIYFKVNTINMMLLETACESFELQLLLQIYWNLALRGVWCCVPSRNLACALSLFAFSVCSGAVNKEIDDKVVEKRQLDRTARHEWQRACSAFTAKNVAPSRELAMPGRCAKTVQCVARGVCSLYEEFLLGFQLALLK